MDGNKAEVIGLLCAEGNYYDERSSYFQYYPERKKSYFKRNKRTVYIQFANFDEKLLKRFQHLIKKVYGYSPRLNSDRVRICRRKAITDLLKFTNYGCLNWKMPPQILKNKNLLSRFIKGYFEGDGSHCKNKICFSSSNYKGLTQVKKGLEILKIKSSLYGPYQRRGKEKEYLLQLRRESWDRFLTIIKPRYKCL